MNGQELFFDDDETKIRYFPHPFRGSIYYHDKYNDNQVRVVCFRRVATAQNHCTCNPLFHNIDNPAID